jgi:hypothetical protein
MIGAAVGVGATSLAINGNPHAGVVFHRSSTVGLLFSVTPYTHSLPASCLLMAYRMSVLSMAKVVILRTVSHLEKATNMGGPCASKEQRNILGKFEVAVLGLRLRSFCVGK